MPLRLDDVSRKTILGGSKDMRSSDSSKKAFVPKEAFLPR